MKGLFVILAACLVGTNALATKGISGRVGGSAPLDGTVALHACILLVERRPGLDEEGIVRLGGGSIVSRNRVVTARHVVFNAVNVQTAFYVGTTLRRVDTANVQQHNDFDSATYAFDFAILRFPSNSFPLANVIPIAPAGNAPTGALSIMAYGFTTPGSTGPSRFPHLSEQTVEDCDPEIVRSAETHFCAAPSDTSILCPGDTGSGIYEVVTAATADDPEVRLLVGVVSSINGGCEEQTQSAFTDIGQFTEWLALEGVVPATP